MQKCRVQVLVGADLKSLSPVTEHCHLFNITVAVCWNACAGPLTNRVRDSSKAELSKSTRILSKKVLMALAILDHF